MISPANWSRFVNSTSFLLGFTSPLGWLCAITILAVATVSAVCIISRGWAGQLLSVPWKITCRLTIWFFVSKHNNNNLSWSQLAKSWANCAPICWLPYTWPKTTWCGCGSNCPHRNAINRPFHKGSCDDWLSHVTALPGGNVCSNAWVALSTVLAAKKVAKYCSISSWICVNGKFCSPRLVIQPPLHLVVTPSPGHLIYGFLKIKAPNHKNPCG